MQRAQLKDFLPIITNPNKSKLKGEMVEMGPTQKIFTSPTQKRTEDYITGRFG